MGRGLSFQYGTAHILNYLVFTHNAYRYHQERMALSSGVRQTEIGVIEFSRFGSNLATLWGELTAELRDATLSVTEWDSRHIPNLEEVPEFLPLFEDNASGHALFEWTWDAFWAWWPAYQPVMDQQTDSVRALSGLVLQHFQQSGQSIPHGRYTLLGIYDNVPPRCVQGGLGYFIVPIGHFQRSTDLKRISQRIFESFTAQ